ncbi:beta-mannosidase [Solitalea longa]|uniref:Beta-mannosidase n=1 Tax=Solitalea longa TaxID=2079460 RepID=A0A2S5A231_9SPHI|nr:glycosyl hydrolase [Solitalea longa]POY36650.1 beta-mannosidase [Solitalea longa]
MQTLASSYKLRLAFFTVAAILLAASCKKGDSGTPDDTDITPPGSEVPSLATVRSWLADKNATEETAALFYNLKKMAKTNVLFGHQDATKRGVTDANTQWANEQQFSGVSSLKSDVKDVTGAYPAVYGFDYLQISGFFDDTWGWFSYEKQIARQLSIEAYNRGGVCTYSWHYGNPVSKGSFYWSDSPVEAVSKILPGGSEHETFKNSLKIVADHAKTLVGADGKLVPVIFRPFHEFDGDWFWWGKAHCTAEQYKALYKFTVTYLRDELGVHNFIYAWSPGESYTSEAQYLERYPGDAYVDLVGTDNYGDMKVSSNPTTAANKFKIVSDYAKRQNKLAALTETGLQNLPKSDWYTQILLKSLKQNKLEFCYAMVWANTKDAYWTPYKGHAAESDFKTFKSDPYMLFGDKLTATTMYKIK